jgi:hypothetical protein
MANHDVTSQLVRAKILMDLVQATKEQTEKHPVPHNEHYEPDETTHIISRNVPSK